MSMSENLILSVRNLDVKFYTYAGVVHAVSNVSFDVYKGEIVALVGETGSGKTVATKAITKLIDPPGRIEDGKAFFRRRNGNIVDLLNLSDEEIRRIRGDEIAYVFQDPTSALDPLYTIGHHFFETMKDHGKVGNKNEALRRAVSLLRETLIPSPEVRVKNYPHELSGGMRQRSVIAIGLSNDPVLLIADEPTTNLDVTIQAQILDLIKDIQTKHAMSVILITHNLGVVAETAHRVYVMYAGKIVEEATVEELFEDAQHPYTTLLLRTVPNPLKRIEKLESIPGTVPSLINPAPGCRFRDRCPFATEKCQKEPPMVEMSKTHRVYCWLHAKR